MEIDPILSLAITMHSNKGCYAALLGSGISRPAGIPTGWGIVIDLIEQIARSSEEVCDPTPESWYVKKFGKEPNYSDLLATVAKTSHERRSLLQEYFEPSKEDREAGTKTPTKAHKELAKLVEKGFVKVIVTTNFDRLMEQALDEIGISPQVISTPNAVLGSPPIQHSECTILKIHGDYLDTRIKNSEEELAKYDRKIDRLLDRIFDEYGLIICGWSGDWDPALRSALERRKGRRFATYWVAHGEPSQRALDLIRHMDAGVLKPKDADEFFQDLSWKIQSLDDLSKKHPLSSGIAVATLKRYLAKDEHRIQLADLVKRETENAYAQLVNADFLAKSYPNNQQGFSQKLDYYNTSLDTLVSLIAHGCYWGRQEHAKVWVSVIERFARSANTPIGLVSSPDLRPYTGSLLLYAGGVAAVLGGNYSTLASIFGAKSYKLGEDRISILDHLRMDNVTFEVARSIQNSCHASRSIYLAIQLDRVLGTLEPDDGVRKNAFDRFECLLAMEYISQKLGPDNKHSLEKPPASEIEKWAEYTPIGRFGLMFYGDEVLRELQTEIDLERDKWEPLESGLFFSTYGRPKILLEAIIRLKSKRQWH